MRKLGIAIAAAGLAATFAPAPAQADVCVTTFEEFGEICTRTVPQLAGQIATCAALAETPGQLVGCVPNPYGAWIP